MKNINIEVFLKNKSLGNKCYEVEDDIDFLILDDTNRQLDMLNNDEYKKVESAIYSLDIFKYINLPVSELNSKDTFRIVIKDDGKTYKTKFKAFRNYNCKLYFGDDLYIYGETIYVKEEFLNKDSYRNFTGSFKPNYKFFGSSNMYYGFELEISCGNLENHNFLYKSLIEKNLLKNNRIILKNDGSIVGDYGVEIVSAPHSRKELNKVIVELSGIFKEFQSGAKGHNAGGMHIHCSLAPLTAKSNLNLLRFMFNYRNLESFYKIAQRSESNYAEFNIDHVINQQELLDFIVGENKKIKNSDRYSAINFTDNTVEFRVFNSSLRDDRMLKNLDFVEACIEYVKSKDFSKEFEDFRSFIKSKGNKYKYLKDYIQYSNEE